MSVQRNEANALLDELGPVFLQRPPRPERLCRHAEQEPGLGERAVSHRPATSALRAERSSGRAWTSALRAERSSERAWRSRLRWTVGVAQTGGLSEGFNSALLGSLILSGWVVEGELVEFDGLGAGLAAAGPALEDRL